MATINSGNSTTLYSTTQTTTSVTPSPALPQDKVTNTNFTTLYSNTSAGVAGGGTSGNSLITGNLRVLGTSDLEGAVTISNSYILPTSDGTSNQVITTDGNGNLTFQSVTSLSSYAIQADTATGGANLTLVGSSTTDSVKFASGTNMSIVRTDANTITISTVADNIPDGTARGQVLYWDGSAWTANNNISANASANRLVATYENSTAGVNSAIFLRKNFGASTYTTNDGVSIGLQLASNSQVTNQIATIAASWNASTPSISLNTNINNNTAGPFVSAGTFTTAQATLPGDLAVNGGDITTTSGIGNLFNANATTVNVGNGATVEVNLGNVSSGRVQIKPATIVGANTTQNVFNTVATTVNAFGAATAVNIGAVSGITTIGCDLYVNSNYEQYGEYMKINKDSTPANSYLYMKGTDHYLKWDQANNFFVISNNFVGAGDIIAVTTLGTNGNLITFNNENTSPAGDSFLQVQSGVSAGVNSDIKWNDTTKRWQDTIDGTNYFNLPNQNLDTTSDVNFNNGTFAGDVAVNGGDLTTTSATGNLFNANATIVNIGNGATTEVNLGNVSSGQVHIKSPLLRVDADAYVNANLTVHGTSNLGNNYVTDSTNVIGEFTVTNNSVQNFTVDRTTGFTGINNTSPAAQLDVNGAAIINGNVSVNSVSIDGAASIDTATATTTSVATVALTTSTRNAMDALVNIIQGADVHVVKATVLRNGSAAMLTTYGEMYNNVSLASFSADVNAGSLRLLITPTSVTSTVFHVVRTTLN